MHGHGGRARRERIVDIAHRQVASRNFKSSHDRARKSLTAGSRMKKTPRNLAIVAETIDFELGPNLRHRGGMANDRGQRLKPFFTFDAVEVSAQIRDFRFVT